MTQSNAATILPGLTISDDVKAEIQNALLAGREAVVSEGNVTIGGWTGTGYIITDPETGAGAYNHKRTYRLYREQGLAVRRRKRKRIAFAERLVMPAPQAPNVSWSMDYVSDGLIDGRKLRALAIVDDYTRECLVIEVDTSLPGARVVAVLERLAELRGLPCSITVDHGPEFESQALDAWAYTRAVRLAFIRPGKPVENAYIESFNGRFRDECLNEHWFMSMQHARSTIETWRLEYNTERPHSSLGYLTPEQFRDAHASRRSADRVRENLENNVSLTPDSTSMPY